MLKSIMGASATKTFFLTFTAPHINPYEFEPLPSVIHIRKDTNRGSDLECIYFFYDFHHAKCPHLKITITLTWYISFNNLFFNTILKVQNETTGHLSNSYSKHIGGGILPDFMLTAANCSYLGQ